jgi:hypothetical protein
MPNASTLLNAAVKYLQEELMPTLSGYHRFQTRVTVNVLNMIKRELELGESHELAERRRLITLISHDGQIDALNSELCDLIRADRINLENPILRDHIRRSLEDALEINNPKWINKQV